MNTCDTYMRLNIKLNAQIHNTIILIKSYFRKVNLILKMLSKIIMSKIKIQGLEKYCVQGSKITGTLSNKCKNEQNTPIY